MPYVLRLRLFLIYDDFDPRCSYKNCLIKKCITAIHSPFTGMIEGIGNWGKTLEFVFKFFHIREFYPSSHWSQKIMSYLCKLAPHMCKFGISIFNGKSGAINATRTSVYMAHTPAGLFSFSLFHLIYIKTNLCVGFFKSQNSQFCSLYISLLF